MIFEKEWVDVSPSVLFGPIKTFFECAQACFSELQHLHSPSWGPQPTSTSKWGREGNPSTGYHALLLLYLGKWQRRNIETVQIRITCIKIRRRKGCKFKQVRDIQNGKISIYQKVVVLTELDKLLFDSWTFLGVCTFWVTWMWFEGEVEGGVGIKLCY